MIVKGIIKTINYSDNSCTVRLPLFETVATSGEVILSAVFMSQPGMYNGYAENDVVFVDFENDSLDSPIVIGKLYLGATAENASAKKGGIAVSSLNVSSDATLPVDTKIAVDRVATVADVDGGITSYKSIADMIKALRNTGSSIERLDKQNNELKDEGIASIKVEYLSQPRENHTPAANDKAWQISSPEYKDGYAIWQKTTWLNYRGQILNTEIICLSELASSATYRIKCSTRAHYGKQQKDALVVTAMAKFGSDFETKDTRKGISLIYKWGSDGEETLVNNSEFEIGLADIQNETLFITAEYNNEEYDTETITYVPLNTPTLSLSSDSSFIEYDSYGLSKINKDAEVQSTASVKLNNEELNDATFSWVVDGCTAKNNVVNQDTIIITDIDQNVDIAYATCNATYLDNLGQSKTLTKTFTIAKNKQGKSFYKIDIFNDYVTISTDENGTITENILKNLPDWTSHEISCYYGDDLLTISEYKNAADVDLSKWQNDINFRVVYNAQNVEIIADKAPIFAISKFSNLSEDSGYITADTGYITYTLYRGTNKVAVSKFEIAKQRQGVSATSYWVDYSARVHKGSNQQDPITATAWTKYGSSASIQNDKLKIRYGWRQADGTFGGYSNPNAGQITVPVANFKNADLIFELGTLKTLEDGKSHFDIEDSEIITYSPINTPILDLTNDNATLVYKPNGEKFGSDTEVDTNVVASVATVFLNGEIVTDGVTYTWSPVNSPNIVEDVKDAIDTSKIIGKKITVYELTADTVEFICTATINNPAIFKNPVTLTKVFTVSKQIQGENSISYWLKVSSGVHLGANQQKTIIVTAMQKVGTNGSEDVDESAILFYKFDKETTWNKVPGRVVVEGENTNTYYDTFDSSTISNFNFKDSDLLIKATHDATLKAENISAIENKDKIFDEETITYSPLNTPTLDLDNDTDTILYPAKPEDDLVDAIEFTDVDGTTKKYIGLPLGNPVKSKATLYLNGDAFASTDVEYTWKLTDCVTDIDPNDATTAVTGQEVTVAAFTTKNDGKVADLGRATCTATVTAAGPFQGKTYEKAFTVSKTRKGDNAINYSLVLNYSSIKVNPNLGTKIPEKLIGTWYIHDGENIQPFGPESGFEYKIDLDNFILGNIDTNGKFEISTEDIDTEIVLQLKVNGTIVKNETISVIRDGENAISPIKLEIENDYDSIPCNYEGQISNDYAYATQTLHKLRLYEGITPIQFIVTNETVENYDGYVISYSIEEGITATIGQSSGNNPVDTFEASITKFENDTIDKKYEKAKITYNVYKGKDTTILATNYFIVEKRYNSAPTVKIDILNDFVSVPCDSNKIINWDETTRKTETTHTIQVYEGLTTKEFTVVSSVPTNEDTAYRVYQHSTGVTAVKNDMSTLVDSYTNQISDLSTDVGTISYDLYKGTTLISSTKFEATKIVAGKDGESYKLIASASQIKQDKLGNKAPGSITFNAIKQIGNATASAFSDAYFKVYIDDEEVYIDDEEGKSIGQKSNGEYTLTSTTDVTSEVKVEIYYDSTYNVLLDRETIPVVVDGEDLVDYYVLAEPSQVSYNPDDDTYILSNKTVKFTFWKQVGNDTPTELKDSSFAYSLSGGATQSKTSIGVNGYITATLTKPEAVTINLYTNNSTNAVLLDTETVSVVSNGVSIVSQTTYYALIHPEASAGDILTPNNSDEGLKIKANKNLESGAIDEDGYPLYSTWSVEEKWNTTPPAHTSKTISEGWKYWTTIRTENSLENSWFSTPIINEEVSGAYALAQGKNASYYSDEDPNNGINIIKKGDCWFDTSQNFVEVTSNLDKSVNENGSFSQKEQYIGYYYKENGVYYPITKDNIDSLINNGDIKVEETIAYKQEQNCLKQWNGSEWKDIGEELVANKLTANYINALDITSKKVTIIGKNNSEILFDANGLIEDPYVKIAGFKVTSNGIISGGEDHKTSLDDDDKPGVYIGPDGISIGDGFKVTAGEAGNTEITLSDTLMNELKAANYTIISNTSQVVRDPITANYNPASVEFTFYKQLGSDTPTKLTSTDSTFAYSLNGGSTKSGLTVDGKVTITTSTLTSNSITCDLYLVDPSDRSKDILIASKTVSILNDAVSPYTLDIYNDKVSALTNTGTIDWTDDQLKTNTTHKIKVLQGTVATKLDDITIRQGTYTANTGDKDLVLVYEYSSSISSISSDTGTEYEVVNYITDITSDANKYEINYTLYYRGIAVATSKFELLKIQFGENGRSIESVTNYYFATTTDSSSLLPPKTALDEATKDPNKGYWKTSITLTGYGTNAPYLWNFEQIIYDKELNGKKTSETAEEVISYYASDGSAAITYWIKGVETTHAGSNQTSTIPVTAMKRVGNGAEQVDSGTTGAVIWYNNDGTWKSRLGGDNAANCHTLNFNPGEFYDGYDIKLILTHDKTWRPDASTNSTDSHVKEWEVITYSPATAPVIDLSNDSAQLYYANDTKAKNEVSSTAALYLAGKKLESANISYSWAKTNGTSGNCTFKNNITNTDTITITAIDEDSASVTCTISINGNGIDGKFKNTSYQKTFNITKVRDGKGISEVIELYQLTATTTSQPPKPESPEDAAWRTKGWSKTIQQPDASNPYLWNVEITIYTTNNNYDYDITNPAIIGTYGETFGVNIEPSASSIKLQYPDGEKEYSPATLTFKFREVSGTNVKDCCDSDREYRYKLFKVEGGTETPLCEYTELTTTNKEVSLDISAESNQTTGQYKAILELKNHDAWVIVDSETIPVVLNNETLSCVIESTLGTSFNQSSRDYTTKTTTLIAHLYKGMTEEDSDHTYYYEWYEIDNTAETPEPKVLACLTAEELSENYIGSDAWNKLTSLEQEDYLERRPFSYRGAAGSHEIVLKLSELQNKSIYFIAYPGGAPSTGGSILGIARLGMMPLGK